MAFESLSERLQNALKMFRGNGKLTEEDLKAPMREVWRFWRPTLTSRLLRTL